MLGRDAAAPQYLCPKPGDGFWRRRLTPLKDAQSWLDVVWWLVGLITGTLAFAITLVWWAATLIGLTYWFWQRFIPGEEDGGLADLLGLGSGRAAESWVNLAVGVFGLVTLPWVVRFAAVIHASLAQVLLCSRADLQREVAGSRVAATPPGSPRRSPCAGSSATSTTARSSGWSGSAVDLGRARRQLRPGPREGRRDDRRGARPDPRDRRRAALPVARHRPAAAGRSRPDRCAGGDAGAERRTCHRDGRRSPPRLPPHVETAVYFVVAEALTNVAKHSAADAAIVSVTATRSEVDVRIEDDGIGGAHPAKGLGLSGLRQRLHAPSTGPST